MVLRQNEPCSCTTIFTTINDTKFGLIHQPWLKKMLVELDKLHQKEDDVVKISMANLPRKYVFCCFQKIQNPKFFDSCPGTIGPCLVKMQKWFRNYSLQKIVYSSIIVSYYPCFRRIHIFFIFAYNIFCAIDRNW